jgi:hypothetical protein
MANSIGSKNDAYPANAVPRTPSATPTGTSDPIGKKPPGIAQPPDDASARETADGVSVSAKAIGTAADVAFDPARALQQAQQVRTQLGLQPLAIANRQPTVLLGLFR